ncbi:GTPase family protein [Desulfobulbus alkaliphilus]|uniref:GTPase family protein n=1 Tax=Desulfobulbus alkaliphilus TaxID=869814 RepID=UPI001965C431|nr:GTPase [Desulfobulbus alkaliphilus]MBM9538491.1 50S ribosome-binding GTPase [Desulfobulbus alkaliphilus]
MISKIALLRGFGVLRLLAMLLAALPLLVLPILGTIWIWLSDHRTLWLTAMGICAVSGYALHLLGSLLERSRTGSLQAGKSRRVEPHATSADPNWSPRDGACWDKVEEFAQRTSPKDWNTTDVQRIAQLGRDTLEVVARHYKPEAEKPLLELTIPHALLIIERASRELRADIVRTIPFSHQLTMGFLLRINRWREMAQEYEKLYRLGRAVFSPYSALFHEVRRNLGNSIAGYGLDNVKAWLLREYVRKVGFYAIELYSEKLLLSDADPVAFVTSASRQDINRTVEQSDLSSTSEPLRILILGRANVGKSSLINALFGRLQVVTDALPGTTQAMRAYRLERDGRDQALILDAPGCDTDLLPLKALRRAVLDADLILWVAAANRADRQPDREQLDRIRTWYAEHPSRSLPPLVVVLTYIDQLRPVREWQPPYDLSNPDDPKAASIAEAVQTVSRDLNIPLDLTIPVCLAQGRLYNVEDTLAAVILELQDESEKARFLRCLEARKGEEFWGNVKQQLKTTGRMLGSILR